MTAREVAIIRALARVSFLPGHPHKRFVRNILAMAERNPAAPLSTKQRAYLTSLAWRYRRQMPATLAYPMTEDEVA